MAIRVNTREQSELQQLGISFYITPPKETGAFKGEKTLCMRVRGWNKETRKFEQVTAFLANSDSTEELNEYLSTIASAVGEEAVKGAFEVTPKPKKTKEDAV